MATHCNSMSRLASIEQALRLYFSSELSVQDAEDSALFRAQMLRDDNKDTDSGVKEEGDKRTGLAPVHRVLVGVSGAPYVAQLAVILYAWHETGVNPLQSITPDSEASAMAIEGVTPEFTSRQAVLAISVDAIRTFVAGVQRDEEENVLKATASLVGEIGGARGVLTLLGFQQTVGSRSLAPLTLHQCLAAFTQRFTPGEPLSVGARAFSKHCARSSSGWWGELKGNDAAKNERAERKVRDVLASATWKNIHSLPHAQATMEVRNALGYGARWDAETRTFRGFLEPPMVNGHETKWRH
ncbi:hypothetical protein PRNP1_013422 [Phytophthora ramorum]